MSPRAKLLRFSHMVGNSFNPWRAGNRRREFRNALVAAHSIGSNERDWRRGRVKSFTGRAASSSRRSHLLRMGV
jgi:hypothetical protein